METVQQRSVEQVIDVLAEESRKEFDPVQQCSVEQVIDVPAEESRKEFDPVQQRSVEQVIDVPAEESRKEFDPVQQRSVEQVIDVPGDEGPSASAPPPSGLDEGPLNVTRRVGAKAAPYEGSIARAVRLELERVRYEKEARRRYLRARARSPHRARQ